MTNHPQTPTAQIDAGGFISGVIDFDNAGDLKLAGEAIINKAGNELTFDLSAVERANSLTVALLAGWLRSAKFADVALSFVGVSVKLMAIIEVCGLNSVLPVRHA